MMSPDDFDMVKWTIKFVIGSFLLIFIVVLYFYWNHVIWREEKPTGMLLYVDDVDEISRYSVSANHAVGDGSDNPDDGRSCRHELAFGAGIFCVVVVQYRCGCNTRNNISSCTTSPEISHRRRNTGHRRL